MKTIQDLEEINKPREKLYKKGTKALKDYEMMMPKLHILE